MQTSPSGLSGMTSVASAQSLRVPNTRPARARSRLIAADGAIRGTEPPHTAAPNDGERWCRFRIPVSCTRKNDDADRDGAISLHEAENSPVADALSTMFEAIDTDGDGRMTEAEMAEFENSMVSAQSGKAGAMGAKDGGGGDSPPLPVEPTFARRR